MIDYHIHSDISSDCGVSMRRMAASAREKGFKEICFTEHIDLDLPGEMDFTVDFNVYRKRFNAIKNEYADMNLRMGVEAGLGRQTKDKVADLLDKQELDYVIGSQHIIFGHDPFYKGVWEQYSQRQVYDEYLRTSIESVKECDFFDVFGHLGYIAKFCPFDDKLMRYRDYTDAIDTLLISLVHKGKGLEVNTNGLFMTPDTMPERPVIKRFFELGGEIVTIGSDAHYENVVGHAVHETLGTLKDIGFKYVCAFDGRRPRFITIDSLL
ncbi:MAG: histidinol-phosphatase HisJ family protein [Eubacteriales bacterium]|nr:histidinol-phosphatase HisJ family protein [Eubacteriales bacterium]